MQLSDGRPLNMWSYNKSELIFLIMFICIFPQSIYTQFIGILAITDEFFAICGFFSFIRYSSRRKVWQISSYIKKIFIILILLLSLGWISTLVYKIQRNINANLSDCFTFVKFYLIFFYSIKLLTQCYLCKITNVLYRIVKVYLFASIVCLILNLLIDIGMTEDYRFGIRAFKFINSNAGDYSSILVISLSIIIINEAINCRRDNLLKIICLICLFMTLRGKAIGLGFTFIALDLFLKKHSYLNRKALIGLSILGIIGGFFQLKYYFIDNVTPRSLFLANGIITANNYFPLGAGYSTYGSNMAKVYYSPLYDKYGFDSIWGMNSEDQQFLNDNFWPMVMGQFGWFGTILYLSILCIIFNITNRHISSRKLKLAGLTLFFLIAYSSVGGPILLHYIGCATAIVYGLILTASEKCTEFVL